MRRCVEQRRRRTEKRRDAPPHRFFIDFGQTCESADVRADKVKPRFSGHRPLDGSACARHASSKKGPNIVDHSRHMTCSCSPGYNMEPLILHEPKTKTQNLQFPGPRGSRTGRSTHRPKSTRKRGVFEKRKVTRLCTNAGQGHIFVETRKTPTVLRGLVFG